MTRLRILSARATLLATVTLVVTAAVLLLGLLPGRAQGPPAGSSALPSSDMGRLLYQQDCAWCHGGDGDGTTYGPSLIGVGAASADFMLRTGRMPISAVERQPPRTSPAYGDEQIAALVSFVASLGPGPGIPAVDPAAGDLAEGAQLYQTHCAACHSSTGYGGALTNGLQAPDLWKASPVEIAEAVRIGGAGLRSGHMPRFGQEVLTDHQLDGLARYVLFLQHPDDRGGFALGHIGPIAEGFAAWLGALLILVLFTMWIGKRTA